MSSHEEELTITLPLKEFCHIALGNGYWYERPIPRHIAEIIAAKTKNDPKYGFFVQLDEGPGQELSKPILWDYKKWSELADRWERQKKYSEQRRIEKFIEAKNIQLIAREVRAVLQIHGDASFIAARRILEKRNMGFIIGFLGVEKLITKKEEL